MKIKNFDDWTVLKKKINERKMYVHANEGTVWFCSIGENVGHEEGGKNLNYERPVLVLRRWTHECFLGIPMTRTLKKGDYFYNVEFNKLKSSLILMQIRTFDFKRLTRKIGSLSDVDLYEIRKRVCLLINKANPPVMADSRKHNRWN